MLGRPSLSQRQQQRASERAANLRALCTPSRAIVSARMGGASSGKPIEKHDYIRSPALMKAYREIPCQNCGKTDGTVCGAHANLALFGKGRGIKADDNRAAALCFTCHGMLDQGSILSRAERAAMWWCAHIKTVRELVRLRLWPQRVPVPDLEWKQ